jgi:hypothetical protein
MTVEQLWLVAAIALAVIAGSFVAIAIALWRLSADGRAAARSTDQLARTLQAEAPPTLAALEKAAHALDELAADSSARLPVVERLADEGEATMAAVRELSGSVNEILRGPAGTVTGVRKSARMVGGGIASGADRLRRAISGDGGPDDGP